MTSKIYYPRNVAKAFALAKAGKVAAHTDRGQILVWLWDTSGHYRTYKLCATLPEGCQCFFAHTRDTFGEGHSGGLTFRAPLNP